jgi:hypothetical protein
VAVARLVETIELTGTDPGDAWAARRFVSRAAEGQVPERMLADMQTVASELVQMVHRPEAVGPIELVTRVAPGRASVTLRCATGRLSALPPRPHRWPHAQLDPAQIGLRIVWGLSDGVRSHRVKGVLSITARFRDRPRRRLWLRP